VSGASERARWLLTATQEAAKVGRRSLRNRRALVSHLKVLLTSGVQNSAAEAAHACMRLFHANFIFKSRARNSKSIVLQKADARPDDLSQFFYFFLW
jgi:hypothetical protein